jgi:hypothetical protein
MFKPDAIFTIKNRQKIVFQVLSSQAEKNIKDQHYAKGELNGI